MRSFVKIKPSRNGEITLSFTNKGKSSPGRDFFANMSFYAIRENKILAKKVFAFTVFFYIHTSCVRVASALVRLRI